MSRPTPPRTITEFDGRRGQFAGGGRVHDVALQPWIEGLEVPGPACHTPNGGFDPASFQPVDGGVTCRRCLRCSGTPASVTPQVDANQLDLLAGLDDTDGGCGDPDCPDCCPDEPCPVDCACAWCTPTRRVLVTTVRPDPAYL